MLLEVRKRKDIYQIFNGCYNFCRHAKHFYSSKEIQHNIYYVFSYKTIYDSYSFRIRSNIVKEKQEAKVRIIALQMKFLVFDPTGSHTRNIHGSFKYSFASKIIRVQKEVTILTISQCKLNFRELKGLVHSTCCS